MRAWLRQRDPNFAALRRATRTAIVMPSMFALGKVVIGNPTVGTFAAFGSFSMLLLIDFPGPIPRRVLGQAALALTGALLICLATLVSSTTWLAVVAITVVGFAVLFAGIVSSVLASVSFPLLIAFIVPISLPGPVSSIPDRLAGWGLATAAALVAVAVLWPVPARDAIRTTAIAAIRAVARRLRGEAQALGEIATLHTQFFATPYRPTGLSTSARAAVRLVDELEWLRGVLDAPACALQGEAATVLERGAELLEAPSGSPEPLRSAMADLQAALMRLEDEAPPSDGVPSFRAQELSYIVLQIASNIDLAAAAERRTWLEQLLGRQPFSPLAVAQERASAHVDLQSIWLRNSIRGGVGLGLSVLVVDVSNVQHGLWVILGTLSVLRSNALRTGQNTLRALGGTAIGIFIGAVLVTLIGTHTAILWACLPIAILGAGLAPVAISFAAGQAAFTVTLLILFNIIAPEGWKIGLVRIEDVLIGGAVSVVVGLALWPRGATAALTTAVAQAYTDSARYLTAAVRYAVDHVPPTAEAVRAAASSRRLDDTFRSYLAERGTKPASLAETTRLITGAAALRLAGDAVLDLWQQAPDDDAGGRELLAGADAILAWYVALAASLTGGAQVPEPAPATAPPHASTPVRVVWTREHLDAARRLEVTVAEAARARFAT